MDVSYMNRYEAAKCFVMNNGYEKFFRQVSKTYKICVFGMGALGSQIIQWLKDADIVVDFVSDNLNKGGISWHDIQIISPDELYKIRNDVFVIVGVANKEIRHNRDINEQLKYYPLVFHNPLGITIYWHQTFDAAVVTQMIDGGFSLSMNSFEDKYSRELYLRLWEYRLQSEVIDYKEDELSDVFYPKQYLVQELFYFEDIHSMVDAGAYTGDTISDFVTEGIRAEIYAFEMDSSIFMQLKDKVAAIMDEGIKNRIHLYNYALSDKRGVIKYDSVLTGNSHIDKNTNFTAETISLDDLRCAEIIEKVDFIKMDIEGAEESALRGAIKTIRKDHPILAISIYHNFSQFLNIPSMIKQIEPKYKLYLRHHKHTLDDTVLYAICD